MNYSNPFLEECLNGTFSLLGCLKPEEKEYLSNHNTYAHYRRGEIVFVEGEKPHGLIFVSIGKVKVYKQGVGGREQIVRMVSSQGLLGYRALFASDRYSATAVAIEDTTVCMFEKSAIIKVIRKNPGLALTLMEAIAKELGFSNDRTISLTQKHVRGRLAESLLVLRDTYGLENDGFTIKVYLSREDIANLSNMTTSNAIRTLSSLASENVIALEGRKIKIIDLYKLEKISEMG